MRSFLLGLILVFGAFVAGFGVAVNAGTQLYVEPVVDPLRQDYPELFTSEAVVLVIGADWCFPCRAHKANLSRYVHQYNIKFVKIDDENRQPTKWRDFLIQNELRAVVPTTVIVENGKIKKSFRGITPWRIIRPFADKAVKKKVE